MTVFHLVSLTLNRNVGIREFGCWKRSHDRRKRQIIQNKNNHENNMIDCVIGMKTIEINHNRSDEAFTVVVMNDIILNHRRG